MKENAYNNPGFFEKYSKMARSVKGLEGAGEWHELKKLLPDFNDRRVLDLGCGYGWHCAYASDHGAKTVTGVDLSSRMLQEAARRNKRENITYIQSAMEEFQTEARSMDAVISSLAFHYVENFTELTEKIYDWLVPGGSFVFSVEHPVFTAYGSQDWYYGTDGEILHFPVDHYYYEGKREAAFLGEKVIKYHRTLTTYVETLLKAGFSLKALVEPMPPESMMDLPGMKDELRRPMMLLIAAEKG